MAVDDWRTVEEGYEALSSRRSSVVPQEKVDAYFLPLRDAMLALVARLKVASELAGVHPRFTEHGLTLSMRRTGTFVTIYWDKKTGYHVEKGKPDPESYWADFWSHDCESTVDAIREYIRET
jgi:hypothetical protein